MLRIFQLVDVPFNLTKDDGNGTITDFLRKNLITTILAGDFNMLGSVAVITTTATSATRSAGIDTHHLVNGQFV